MKKRDIGKDLLPLEVSDVTFWIDRKTNQLYCVADIGGETYTFLQLDKVEEDV